MSEDRSGKAKWQKMSGEDCPGSVDLMREPVADLGDISLDEPVGSFFAQRK